MKIRFIEDYELITSDDKDRAKKNVIKAGTEKDVNETSFDWWMQQGVVEEVKAETKRSAPKKTKKPAIPAVPAPEGE